MTLFAWWGKEYFNIINALMAVLLVMEIYWIANKGRLTLNLNYSYIFWIFFSLWVFNLPFVDTFLWLSGSCEYLWTMVLMLAFLIPYIRVYYYVDLNKLNSKKFVFVMFVLGIISGCSRELTVCWLILVLTYWLFKKRETLLWEKAGCFGFIIGYGVLVFAPGNFARLAIDENTNNFFLTSELIEYKIALFSIIAFFHLFLWHYVLSSIVKLRKLIITKSLMQNDKELFMRSLSFVKACIFVVLCSGILTFFTRYHGTRPFFVNLVFLTIAVATLFRAQKDIGLFIISNRVKSFFKFIGISYFLLTMLLTIYYNYMNWKQWNSILATIEYNTENGCTDILELTPYITSRDNRFISNNGVHFINLLSGTNAGTWAGFHLINMPVYNDANNEINIVFSKYYGLKGIIVKNDK
jgi:hypothetical protein